MSTASPVRLTTTQCWTDGLRRHGVVRVDLQGHGAAPAVAAVGGDHDVVHSRVVDAAGERVGRETAEDDGVGRPDARAGEHRDGQLGDHRHVDGDPVALLHAEGAEGVGEPADLVEEVRVGEGALVARLALPVVGDLVAEAVGDVAVETVVR